MPYVDEKRSSLELIEDAHYHGAALAADPRAAALGQRLAAREAEVESRFAATRAAEKSRLAAHARMIRAEGALTARTREVELAVRGLAGEGEESPIYRACFPHGLPLLASLRGPERTRAIGALTAALREHAPTLAPTHVEALGRAAADATTAESTYLDAEHHVGANSNQERIARLTLIRALQANDAALQLLYPGQRAKVRSYFRPRDARAELEADQPEGSGPGA